MASYFIQLPATTPAGGEVNSFNGRTGVVVSVAGDYTASQVTFVPTGTISSTDVQAAIAEVALEAGNVVGPGSSTDKAVARFSGTSGLILQDSGVIVDNSNNVYIPSRLGIGQATPKAAIHVGAGTTSGTVNASAIILGVPDTTANVGPGAVIMSGSQTPNKNAGTDTLVGGHNSFAVVSTQDSIFWGQNVGSDSDGNWSAVFGSDSKTRGNNTILAGLGLVADFGANYSFMFGRTATSTAVGASFLGDGNGNSVTNGLTNSLLSRFSNGWRRVKTALDATSPIEQTIQDIVSTTDATVTTLQSFTTASNTNYLVEARVNARRTGGASGTAGDGAGYIIRALVKNVGGTVTVNGLQTSFTYEDQAGWDATIVASGTAFLVQITGAASNNITWTTTTLMTIL